MLKRNKKMIRPALLTWLMASWLLLPAAAQSDELVLADVVRAPLSEVIHLDGRIEAVQQSTVSAQTSGTVVELPFDVDDSVAAGDLIVRLEDSEQRSRLNQAPGGLDAGRAGPDTARQQYERVGASHGRALVSRQEFDQPRHNLGAALARVERAEAA